MIATSNADLHGDIRTWKYHTPRDHHPYQDSRLERFQHEEYGEERGISGSTRSTGAVGLCMCLVPA